MTLAEDISEVNEVTGRSLMKAIVPSHNEHRLYANIKNFLPGVMDKAIADDAPTTLNKTHVVKAFMKVLAVVDEGTFSETCRVKLKGSQKKITPKEQKALMYDAALGKNQL